MMGVDPESFMTLAASVPTMPPGFESWAKNLFYLLGILALVLVIKEKVSPRKTEAPPQPFRVKKDEELATKCDIKNVRNELLTVEGKVHRNRVHHDRQVENLKAGINEEFKELERLLTDAGQKRAEKLHDRIDQVLAAVSEVRGQLKK